MTSYQELARSPAVPRGVPVDDSQSHAARMMPRDMISDEPDDLSVRLEAGALRLERSRWKRMLDVLGAAGGIIFLLPLFLIVAAAIVIESPGPPLFKQRRTGHGGVPFVIYKFRSMRVQEDGSNVVQAQREDDRITGVGRLLRRTSVDELPQLLNVLKGEMSLVGPRPHALAHDVYYGELVSGYEDRFKTKPGLTGLAQVAGLRGQTAVVDAMAARIEKDLEYIRDWSFFLDIRILLKTVMIFAFHPAAY